MSTSTTKLGLIKPAKGEKLSRATYNLNLDKVDAGSIDLAKIRHFEAKRDGQNDVPIGTLWGPGAIMGLRNSAKSFNDDFVASPSSGTDGIKLTKEGIYNVAWGIGNAGGSANLWHIVTTDGTNGTTANGNVLGRVPIFDIPTGDWYWCYAKNFYVGPSGKDIFFKLSNASGGSIINHQIRIDKIQ